MVPWEMREFVQKHCTSICMLTFTGFGLVLLRRWMNGGICRSRVRLDGKTVIITGANVGIGKETAMDIARRGARVILACRDLEKAEKAAASIREETGNGNILVRKLDLASLESVRAFAKEIQDTETQLDVLVNNAGIMRCPKWKTEDGFEMQFGVNHLGHFLLTNLLLGLLKKSTPSRIVNVSSIAHTKGQINFDDINLDQKYDSAASYNQSKLANVLFTRELAKRLVGTGVTANSLHPGVVLTDLGRHILPTVSLWLKIALAPLVFLICKNPWQGAQTNIHCAVAEELEKTTGLYFSDCAPKEPAPQAKDDEVACKLWELSAQMVGLDK